MEQIKKKGTNVYFIPGGGSNALGALGYVECVNEIINDKQKINFSHIVHGTGSAGTQAGLLAGKKFFNYQVPVVGISVRFKKDVQESKVYDVAKDTCNLLECEELKKEELLY